MSGTTTTQPEPNEVISFMDREGRRWPLRDVRPFFIPDFYEAVRITDGVRIVVHRTDFLRKHKG